MASATLCPLVPRQPVRRRVPSEDEQGKAGVSPALSRNCEPAVPSDRQAREPAFGAMEGLRGEGVDRSASANAFGMRLLPFFVGGDGAREG